MTEGSIKILDRASGPHRVSALMAASHPTNRARYRIRLLSRATGHGGCRNSVNLLGRDPNRRASRSRDRVEAAHSPRDRAPISQQRRRHLRVSSARH